MTGFFRRLRALTVKELRQISRDPSSIMIGLALPIILWGGAVWLLLSLMLRVYHRSAISAAAILLCSLGVFLVGVEFLIDRWLTGVVDLSWSLVVLTICVCVAVPLVIIRRIPAVREEVRRRFHM